ncbi:MAG: aldo/keto reductase [bacterium]
MYEKKQMNRRRFLQTSMTGMVGAGMVRGDDFFQKHQDEQEEKLKIKEYRTLGRTGFKVSDIGCGASFLTNVNVAQVALDMGINYIDTGEHYSRGQSETTIGMAMKNRDRKSVFITTKLNLNPRFMGEPTKEKLKERFVKCLERLQTDYVDCLMIHMCTLNEVDHENFHAVAKELKSEDKIRFVGLSNHGPEQRIYGNLEEPMEKVLLASVEDGRFDVVLFVYNFLQKEQGEKIIETCRKKNMGVTLMKTNPVNVYNRWKADLDQRVEAGQEIPETTIKRGEDYKAWLANAEAFKKKYRLRSDDDVRDAAIKFVLSNPGVHSACLSFNSFDVLESFVRLSGKKLKRTDTSLLNDYESTRGHLYCRHACGICEPSCEHGVPVNTIMRYNHYFEAQGREKQTIEKYVRLTNSADGCASCSGPCESTCPYGVPVRSLLVLAHKNLTMA